MKKLLTLLLVAVFVLTCSASVIAASDVSYSAGSVYHYFITSGYVSLYPGLMWRHAYCEAYTSSGKSGIYYDDVLKSTNYQLFRPVDSDGNYLGYEASVTTGKYERAYCYGDYEYAPRMYLKISKPSVLGEQVKMSTYGTFGAAQGT